MTQEQFTEDTYFDALNNLKSSTWQPATQMV